MTATLALVLIGALSFGILCALLYLSSILLSRVPYIALRRYKLPEIIAALDLQEGSVLYELGCGDARVVITGALSKPNIEGVGIEHAFWPYLLAKVTWALKGMPTNISIQKGNFYKTDLTQATHVYCYLFPEVITKLDEKFTRELKPGSKVISCDFQIKGKSPSSIIPFKNQTILGKELYVYEY